MRTEGWTPSAAPVNLKARARLLALIREFFADRDVMEVETPVLSIAGNSDPGMTQFQTQCGRWLRTSPEYPLKRLLAAVRTADSEDHATGVGDCYELARVFRAGEAGRWHNPEFTLLEWYRLGWHYSDLMDEVAELVAYCGKAFDRRWLVRDVHYYDWIQEATAFDPIEASAADLQRAFSARGHNTQGLENLSRDDWLDLLITHSLQPALDVNTLTLVSLYPASQAALARLHEPDRRLAERFEVYLGPLELANGYQELTDAAEQRERFESENRKREREGQAGVPLDHHLLGALESGLPECAGVALGVDRLLAALTGASSLAEVMAFPWNRA